MRAPRVFATALGVIVTAGGSALADGNVGVRVLNDTTDNLIVTVYDLNAQPPQPVLSGEIINGNASISISITADSSGRGRVTWNATTVDRDMRKCAHRNRRTISDGGTIRVFANRRCP